MFLPLGSAFLHAAAHAWLPPSLGRLRTIALLLLQDSSEYLQDRDNFYDIFAALVFGFSALNVINLATKRWESHRRKLNYGEVLAITVVVVSVAFLGTAARLPCSSLQDRTPALKSW